MRATEDPDRAEAQDRYLDRYLCLACLHIASAALFGSMLPEPARFKRQSDECFLLGIPELVQIVDRALASATGRGGAWARLPPRLYSLLPWRLPHLAAGRRAPAPPVFPSLKSQRPERAAAIAERASADIAALSAHFPGTPETGILAEEDEAWEQFAGLPEADGPCPALDPATGRCELYAARPLTCRIFGPPVQK